MTCGGVGRSLSQGQPHPPQADIGKSGDRKERYPKVLQKTAHSRRPRTGCRLHHHAVSNFYPEGNVPGPMPEPGSIAMP
jgi:hypothetical protein